MKTLIALLAACAFLAGAHAVSAQNAMTAKPKQEESLFCDLCAIQGCSCSGGQCVDCGAKLTVKTTGDNATPRRSDQMVTREACGEAGGRYDRGKCITR